MARQSRPNPSVPRPDRVEARAIIESSRGQHIIIRTTPGDESRWEFPGGALRPEESPEAALRRTCRAQLGIDLEIVLGQPPFEYEYADERVWFRYYMCRVATGEPSALGCAEVREIAPAQLREYEFEAAAQQVADWLLAGNTP